MVHCCGFGSDFRRRAVGRGHRGRFAEVRHEIGDRLGHRDVRRRRGQCSAHLGPFIPEETAAASKARSAPQQQALRQGRALTIQLGHKLLHS
eukprot:Skav221245  [mRNA]  locus=scaffold1045:239116:241620:- [translate_table: standard]